MVVQRGRSFHSCRACSIGFAAGPLPPDPAPPPLPGPPCAATGPGLLSPASSPVMPDQRPGHVPGSSPEPDSCRTSRQAGSAKGRRARSRSDAAGALTGSGRREHSNGRVQGEHTCIAPAGILGLTYRPAAFGQMSHGIARRNSPCPDHAYYPVPDSADDAWYLRSAISLPSPGKWVKSWLAWLYAGGWLDGGRCPGSGLCHRAGDDSSGYFGCGAPAAVSGRGAGDAEPGHHPDQPGL